MDAKKFEARIQLQSGGAPVRVEVSARSPSEARKIIEAQFSGQIKNWAMTPRQTK